MSAGKEEEGGKSAKRMSSKPAAMPAAAVTDVKPGGQGRVKDPSKDKRLARNRLGPTGQGRVKDKSNDRRLAVNRPGPTGQGRVKIPARTGGCRQTATAQPGRGASRIPSATGGCQKTVRDRRAKGASKIRRAISACEIIARPSSDAIFAQPLSFASGNSEGNSGNGLAEGVPLTQTTCVLYQPGEIVIQRGTLP